MKKNHEMCMPADFTDMQESDKMQVGGEGPNPVLGWSCGGGKEWNYAQYTYPGKYRDRIVTKKYMGYLDADGDVEFDYKNPEINEEYKLNTRGKVAVGVGIGVGVVALAGLGVGIAAACGAFSSNS